MPFAQELKYSHFYDPAEGEKYGYVDGPREDGFFHYTGEGQKGNQRMIRGNAAILHHREKGRALRLFWGARGHVRYEVNLRSIKPAHLTRRTHRSAVAHGQGR